MSLLILGDCHLGKGTHFVKSTLGQITSSRIDDQENLLLFTLNQAIELGVTDLFLTGDIFEEPKPSQNLIKLFLSWLKQVSSHRINTHIITGNHDVLRTGNQYSSPLDIITTADVKRVFVYREMETICIGNLGVTIMPFRDRKSLGCKSIEEAKTIITSQLQYQHSNIPFFYKKLVIGHMALEGSMFIGDEIDDLTNEIMCGPEMFSGYDYVFMGHVHSPQILLKTPYHAHIGSMDQSNFSEIEDKILIHFESEPREIVLPTRRMKNFDLVVPESVDPTDYCISYFKDLEIKNCIIRVNVSSLPEFLPLRKNKLSTFFETKGVFCVEGIYESRKAKIIKKEINKKLDTKIEVPEAIVEFADKNIDESKRSRFIDVSKSILAELLS